MKYIIAIILSLTLVLPVYASEVTGEMSTGISTGISGTVMEAPTANPPAGEYTSTQNVVLSGGPGTVEIRYTTDGSGVDCTSTSTPISVYSTPITVSTSLLIEAISCYPNGGASGTPTFAYAINPPSNGGNTSSGGGGGGGGGVFTTPATSPYDFNSDGRIDILDFNILITNWGTMTGAVKATGDANGDGKVDIYDFNLLIANWQA